MCFRLNNPPGTVKNSLGTAKNPPGGQGFTFRVTNITGFGVTQAQFKCSKGSTTLLEPPKEEEALSYR